MPMYKTEYPIVDVFQMHIRLVADVLGEVGMRPQANKVPLHKQFNANEGSGAIAPIGIRHPSISPMIN